MTIDGVRYTPGPKNKRRPRRLNSTTKKGKIDVGTTEKIGQQIQLMAHTKQTKKMQAINLILTIIDFGLHDVIFPPGWPCFNADSTPSDDWDFFFCGNYGQG